MCVCLRGCVCVCVCLHGHVCACVCACTDMCVDVMPCGRSLLLPGLRRPQQHMEGFAAPGPACSGLLSVELPCPAYAALPTDRTRVAVLCHFKLSSGPGPGKKLESRVVGWLGGQMIGLGSAGRSAHPCTQVHTGTLTHAHVSTRACSYTSTQVHTHAHMSTHMHTCPQGTHAQKYTSTHTHMLAHTGT